ncbi:MAG: isoleucine--tRNA ligase [Planctomycetota bacterium]|nr:isoleucine--tRNA ligase [Planctomycetota bacterium]
MSKTSNYKDTILLPRTALPMRAGLQKLEPRMQKRWKEMDLYGRLRSARAGRPRYVLHDGPPYPTGDLHVGTVLNKVLKDMVVRWATLRGHDSPYLPGWDCHGLPIERKIQERLGNRWRDTPLPEIRRMARELALENVELNRQVFLRYGVLGDFYDPYLTLNPGYEAGVLDVFARMVEQGYVYRKLKSVHWCTTDKTVLAEAELEYRDHESPSIYVDFQVAVGPAQLQGAAFMIWTTTPWTLPGNAAIAVHEDRDYVLASFGGSRRSVVLQSLLGEVAKVAGEAEPIATFKGADFAEVRCRHPFLDREVPVVFADYVATDIGTGVVHTAPGHGREDYDTGVRYDLEIFCPVNGEGLLTEEAGPFRGLHVQRDANDAIIEHLRESGRLVAAARVRHSYPHCWRCHDPVIFRATTQYFVNVDHEDLRERVLASLDGIRFVPERDHARLESMLRERPDWCLSRQRTWGVPIPAFHCNACGYTALDAALIDRVRDRVGNEGADIWYELEAAELLPDGYACSECGARDWMLERDIFDVWFESGASWRHVCENRLALDGPADVYLEGHDQHRGWFQLSLLPSYAVRGRAPFLNLVTHGFTVDEHGRKMSKSLGNYIGARDWAEKHGVDVVRLLLASLEYRNDYPLSEGHAKTASETYRVYRNTLRNLLGNLRDFAPFEQPAREEMLEIDRWALHRLAVVMEGVAASYDAFEAFKANQKLHLYCVKELSAILIDCWKDRLYCDGADWPSRRSALTAAQEITRALTLALSPILVHTTEEVHDLWPDPKADSVHMEEWPAHLAEWRDDELGERFAPRLELREQVLKLLEPIRAQKHKSTDAHVTVPRGVWDDAEALSEWLIAGHVSLGDALQVEVSLCDPCPRCRRRRPDLDASGLCARCTRATG